MEGNPGAIVSTRFSLTTSHLIILSDPLLGLVKFNGEEIDLVSASGTTVQKSHSSDSLKIHSVTTVQNIIPHSLNNTGKPAP
jgi:hypothetical protein